MTLLTVTAIHIFSLAVSGIVLAIGAMNGTVWLTVLGVILAVASIAFELVMHRCPYCHSYIKLTWLSYCPHCGEEILWEDKFYLREKDAPEKKE